MNAEDRQRGSTTALYERAPRRVQSFEPRENSWPKTVEVLIPAYNEEQNIAPLIEAIFAQFDDLRYRTEVIVVDDGSQDGTAQAVRRCCERYPVTLVSLSRNFGKETALLAGLDYARGDATVIMDADFQHSPALIPRFLEEWEAGFQVVYAIKANRRGESVAKSMLVRLFYLLVNFDSRFALEPDALDFRLLDRAVVEALRSMRERVRFSKGLYAWVGFRSKGIPCVPDPRRAGHSKFGARSLLRLGWDGLMSFSDVPLRLSTVAGTFVSVGALMYGAWILARTLAFGADVPGWATLVDAVTLLSGLQMLFLGILGSYVRSIFLETKNRPVYVLRDVLVSPLASERSRAPPSAALPAARLRVQ